MILVKLVDNREMKIPKFCLDGSSKVEDFLDEGDVIKKQNGNNPQEIVVGMDDVSFYSIRPKNGLIILTKYWAVESPSSCAYTKKELSPEYPQKNELELGKDILLEEKSYIPGEDLFDEYQWILMEAGMWRQAA